MPDVKMLDHWCTFLQYSLLHKTNMSLQGGGWLAMNMLVFSLEFACKCRLISCSEAFLTTADHSKCIMKNLDDQSN
jgi:hypothetical protein